MRFSKWPRRPLRRRGPRHPSPSFTDAELRAWLHTQYAVDERGCWIWHGEAGRHCWTTISRRRVGVHRLAYELFVGPIPEGHGVLHHCDVPACFNPSHLFTGTQVDNARDMAAKGRQWKQARTHCCRGHLLAGDNLLRCPSVKSTHRRCRICLYERNTRYRNANRETINAKRRKVA